MAIWLKKRQMKTSPMRVSANSSSQRARARSAMSRGKSAGSGCLSSRYWQITEESDSTRSPSTSTGMRRSGLSFENRSSPKNGTIWSTS